MYIIVEKLRQQKFEASDHRSSTVKSREKLMHSSHSFACLQLYSCVIQELYRERGYKGKVRGMEGKEENYVFVLVTVLLLKGDTMTKAPYKEIL